MSDGAHIDIPDESGHEFHFQTDARFGCGLLASCAAIL